MITSLSKSFLWVLVAVFFLAFITPKQLYASVNPSKANSGTSIMNSVPNKLDLPIFGEIKTEDLSLPSLTVVLGFLDGFNPCAMWALVFLISLLLGMKDKKRMWFLGITFIAVSALVYFLFLTAWLNFFLILGFVLWVRVAIGLVALGAGIYNLRDYYLNREGGCKVTESEQRRQIFEKLKKITKQQKFAFAIAGIIALAVAVNMVELVCSFGLPAVYAKTLSLTKLSTWQYYLYILIYIFFFMVDDIFVFSVAMITLHAVGIQGKYARFSRLVGGILMLIIGLLLIFKPEILMFV